MKRFVVRFVIASVMTIICQVAASSKETKYTAVPMPNGRVRAQADEIDKAWSPPIVHLKGNVRVRIYMPAQEPHGVVVMQADEVDLNQSTGEISPRGNVRLTFEDVK